MSKERSARGNVHATPPRQRVHRHWTEVDEGFAQDQEVPLSYRQVSVVEDDDGTEFASAFLHQPDAGQQRPNAKRRLQACLSSKGFQGMVALLIIINAIVIGLETDEPVGNAAFWEVIENVLLACFSVELGLRIFALGPAAFFGFSSGDFVWNCFDFGLVSIGGIDFLCGDVFRLGVGGQASGMATIFRIFRLLRILRIFRLIRFLKQLYILTYGFALASLAVFWVTLLMAAALYICAIVLVRTYGRLPVEDPDHDFFQAHYGDIFSALFTLFQLMMQPNLMEYHNMLAKRPLLAMFLVIFVIFGSFGMIALLTGVITEAMFEKNVLRLQEEQMEREQTRKYISQRCSAFFNDIKTNEFGEAARKELVLLLPRVAEMFEGMNVQFNRDDLVHVLDVMDTDGSGAINKTEFCRALLHLAERGEELQPILMMELQQDAITFVKRKVERLESSVGRVESMHAEMLAIIKIVAANSGAQAHAASAAATATLPVAPPAAAPVAPPAPPSGSLEGSSDAGEQRTTSGLSRSGTKEMDAGKEPAAILQAVKEAVLKMDKTLGGLQGDMFSVGTRLEEVVSDARSEQISSQLGELAVRRRCMEFESSVSGRLTNAENAARAAQKASEDGNAQVAALAAQVQALTMALEARDGQLNASPVSRLIASEPLP